MAERINARLVSSSSQNWRTSAGRMSALHWWRRSIDGAIRLAILQWCAVCCQKAIPLALAGSLHPLLDRSGRLTQTLVAQLVILYAWHLDVDVDAVEQRAGDALLVFGDDAWRAGAGFDRVTDNSRRDRDSWPRSAGNWQGK